MADVLVTFDEIIRKGFDGHNFTVGLSEHYRDLLFCKDAATLQLMEVSDEVKAKYKTQAADLPAGYLISSLSLLNHCDLNYKSAKNPRLLVELTLMKLAHLSDALQLASLELDPSKKKIV